MSEEIKQLLLGKFTPIKKMKLTELREEVEMWRNIWGWVPSPVKYYVSRTGSIIGVSIRNYTRFVGPLLDTEWELKGVEVGVYDKVFNQVDGEYYYERKIVKLPVGQIVAFDWIAERRSEKELTKEIEEQLEQEQIEQAEKLKEQTPEMIDAIVKEQTEDTDMVQE